METWRVIGISEEDYNTALFEIGCEVVEGHYGNEAAQIMMQKQGFWSWMRIQRDIVDANMCHTLQNIKKRLSPAKAFKEYHDVLKEHFQTVYFPERLEEQFMRKAD